VKVGIQFDSSTQRFTCMAIFYFCWAHEFERVPQYLRVRVCSYLFLHTRSTAKSFLTTVSLVSRRERSLAGAVYIDKITSVPVPMPQNAKPPPPFIHLSSSIINHHHHQQHWWKKFSSIPNRQWISFSLNRLPWPWSPALARTLLMRCRLPIFVRRRTG